MGIHSEQPTRRSAMTGGLAMACTWSGVLSAAPGPAIPPRPPPPGRHGTMLDRLGSRTQPWLDLYHAHTGETFTGWFHDGERYLTGALRDLEVFFADWRDGVAVTMCLRLYWALARVSTEAWAGGEGRSITVLSGYRTPRTNAMLPGAAANSFHMYGRAVDFRIGGWAVSRIADRLEHLEVGGVGRYDGFVHVDSGPPRRWHG